MTHSTRSSQPIVLARVLPDLSNLTAGWNEVARSPHPNYFGYFDGPTFYQGEDLSHAIGVAVNSNTVRHPSDWPAHTDAAHYDVLRFIAASRPDSHA